MPLSNLLAVRVSQETSFLQGDGECEEEMFSVEAASEASEAAASSSFKAIKAALLACQAQYAFQRNWFPDPIGNALIHFMTILYARWRFPCNFICLFTFKVQMKSHNSFSLVH